MIHRRTGWRSVAPCARRCRRWRAPCSRSCRAAHDVGAHDPERMAADIEAFVIALDADLISADDFAR